jgi:hypothetical protein
MTSEMKAQPTTFDDWIKSAFPDQAFVYLERGTHRTIAKAAFDAGRASLVDSSAPASTIHAIADFVEQYHSKTSAYYNNSPSPFVKGLCRDMANEIRAGVDSSGETEPSYDQGRLDEFLHMKKNRPIDPTYWDMHHEKDLRDKVAARVSSTDVNAAKPQASKE